MNTLKLLIPCFALSFAVASCQEKNEGKLNSQESNKPTTNTPASSNTDNASKLPLDHPRLFDSKKHGVRFIIPEGYEAIASQAPNFVSLMNNSNGNIIAIGALTAEEIQEKPGDKVSASALRDVVYDLTNVGMTYQGATIQERSKKEDFGEERKFYSFTMMGKAANGFSSKLAYIAEDHHGLVLTYNFVVSQQQTFDELMKIFRGIEVYTPKK